MAGNIEVNLDVREIRDIVDELRTLNKNLEKVSKSLDSIATEQKKENSPSSKMSMTHKLIEAVDNLTKTIKEK